MRLIAANTLAEYAAQQPGAAALNHWRQMIKAADWKDMNDVKAAASTAEVLNGERVRVEVAGGRFRLIASINFNRAIVFVKFVGAHQEYDRVDALTVSLY